MSGLPAAARSCTPEEAARHERSACGGPLVYAGRWRVMSGLPAAARSCTPEEEAS